MAETTGIAWCDATFNPWVGCTKISAACDFCYAEGWAKRTGHPELWAGERRRTSASNWAQPIKWNRRAKESGRRLKVFCASLADWLDNQAEQQWREDLAVLIDETPHLDWLLLTKRPQNFDRYAPWHHDDVPPNVWLGITAENQTELDRRWHYIADAQARVHFISYEPALGPLSLRDTYPAPDWIIVGGESGSKARPFDIAWAQAIVDETRRTGIACFVKQLGSLPIRAGYPLENHRGKGGDPAEWPGTLQVREFPRPIASARR